MELSGIDVLLPLYDLQQDIDIKMSQLDKNSDGNTEWSNLSSLQKDLTNLFARQIATKKCLLDTDDYHNSDIKVQRKISQYPNFRQWLKSINIPHALSISLESNFESLESLCEKQSTEIQLIAKKCGATESEIQTFLDGVSTLKVSLENSKNASGLTARRCHSLESSMTLSSKAARNTSNNATITTGEVSDDGYATQTSVDRSPGSMVTLLPRASHSINHKFEERKFNLYVGHCGFCGRFLLSGYRCAHCKYKCHKKCASFVPNTCGLTPEIKKHLQNAESSDRLLSNFESSSLPKRHVSSAERKYPRLSPSFPIKQHLNTNTPGSATWHPKPKVNTRGPFPFVVNDEISGASSSNLMSNAGDVFSAYDEKTSTAPAGAMISKSAQKPSQLSGHRIKRISSSTTGASSDDIPSSDSSPRPMKSPTISCSGPSTASNTATGTSSSYHAQIFNFSPLTENNNATETRGGYLVVPKSAPYNNVSSSSQFVQNLLPRPSRSAENNTERGVEKSPHSPNMISGESKTKNSKSQNSILSKQQQQKLDYQFNGAVGGCVSLASFPPNRNGGSEDSLVSSRNGTVVAATEVAAGLDFSPISPIGNSNVGLTGTTGTEDSEDVTLSRGSEHTSTTLTDSENTTSGLGGVGAANSSRGNEDGAVQRWSIGDSFDRRIDDDYDEIACLWDVKLDRLLGKGRFANVWKGYWHGEVAIKVYHHPYVSTNGDLAEGTTIDPTWPYASSDCCGDEFGWYDPSVKAAGGTNDSKWEEALSSARMPSSPLPSVGDTDIIMKDIKTLCKARHNNIVLFMAACRDPRTPAIVTSLCKGRTLYRKIHVLKEEMPMSNVVHILEQVAQGMGYLHGRAIVHKDLRTKNLFVDERLHVTITDYGLANITKIEQKLPTNELTLCCPRGWLGYLAPELICRLTPHRNIDQMLPFTMETDVYAFGAVCYELLSGQFLYEKMDSRVIIWTVGSGCRNSLAAFQSHKSIKDFLLNCWNFNPENRLLFFQIHSFLKELDRKTKSEKSLSRTPSQPIAPMSRSMERMNTPF